MLIFLFSLLSLRLTAKNEILAIGLRVVSSYNLMSGLRGSGFDVILNVQLRGQALGSAFGVFIYVSALSHCHISHFVDKPQNASEKVRI